LQGFARCYDLFEPQHSTETHSHPAPAAPWLPLPFEFMRQFVGALGSRIPWVPWLDGDALALGEKNEKGVAPAPASPGTVIDGVGTPLAPVSSSRGTWPAGSKLTGDEMALSVLECHLYVCVYIRVKVCVYIHSNPCIDVLYVLCEFLLQYVCVCARMCMCMCMCVRAQTHTHTRAQHTKL